MSEHTVKILWGSNPILDERDPIEYGFDTPEELAAFLKGVDEANGWMDYDIVEGDELYTVWVGGGEVTDDYVAIEEANRIAAKFRRDGYDDVVVERAT